MAGIQCKVDIPNVTGLEDQVLTVGREFYLSCEGDWPKNLKQEQVRFEGDAGLQYQLKPLKFEYRTPTVADITVVSYVVGPQQIQNLVLTDGEQKIELGPVQFQVTSVIQPTEKPPEPFGPFGPATISIPLIYWILLVGALLAFSAWVGLRLWRASQRRAMLERLKQHDSALSPIQEFHQNMRRLQRVNPVFYGKTATAEELRQGIEELARMFKVYLSRRLRVPALEWHERLILKDIQNYHKSVYEEFSASLHKLFTEFKKAQASNQKLQEKDVTQLAMGVRKVLEGVEKSLSHEESATGRKGRR